MDKQQREIVSIVEAPEVCLLEHEKAGEVLTKFYKALGWDSSMEILDPCKIRTSKSVFNMLYDLAYERCPDYVSIGMLLVNTGPSVDDDIPDGKVYLLKDWVCPDDSYNHTPKEAV